jgi:hypothetical protein
MNRGLLILFIWGCGLSAEAQKFTSSKSVITFFSDAAIEDIKATNKKGASIIDMSSGEMVFSIPVDQFQFKKSLMQEHFNEKYLETEKYPKATFQGSLEGFKKERPVQTVNARGVLTIHGISKPIEAVGTIEQKGKILVLRSKFIVVLEDYGIDRPQVLWQNIAEQVEVSLEFEYKQQ